MLTSKNEKKIKNWAVSFAQTVLNIIMFNESNGWLQIEISLGYFVAKAGFKCEYLKEMCHSWPLGIYERPNRNGIYILCYKEQRSAYTTSVVEWENEIYLENLKKIIITKQKKNSYFYIVFRWFLHQFK